MSRSLPRPSAPNIALAVNSCTAALHLAAEALGLKAGQVVLVPTMTFAATAEIVRYLGAIPLLVDCDPITGHMDWQDAERKLDQLRAGGLPTSLPPKAEVVGGDSGASGRADDEHGRDQTLCFTASALGDRRRRPTLSPAAWRASPGAPWQRCGQDTSAVTCFSFYANKTITTGEGGMAVTANTELADRMKLMSLHGLSHDAWGQI